MRWFVAILILPTFTTGCVYESMNAPRVEVSAIKPPNGFPVVPYPDDNVPTAEKIKLGRMLFFDPVLSIDSSIACASCHFPEHAFSDIKALSTGVDGRPGFRNAPPLFNLAYQPNFFRDGGIPSLELQVLAPLDNEDEMHMDFQDAVDRLARHPEYPALFKKAFDRPVDGFGLVRALASFERSLLSGNSPYDQYLQGDENALTAHAVAGLELFKSERLGCATCHSGVLFTNFEFINNGLKEDYTSDPGRTRITRDYSDEGKFRVPSLRNVEVTAPYMHDGSLSTLDEVIDHYASGGSSHPVKSLLITGFQISAQERDQLIAFLKSLTDEEFLNNPDFQNPFK